MNRRFFISSSIAVGGVAVLSRVPLLFQVAQGTDGKIISGGSDVSPHPALSQREREETDRVREQSQTPIQNQKESKK